MPENINKLDHLSANEIGVGSSAMRAAVSAGIMRRRPYGGVSFLIRNQSLICQTLLREQSAFVS